jgi:hypothetical protein
MLVDPRAAAFVERHGALIGKLIAGLIMGAISSVFSNFLFALVAGIVSSAVYKGVPWIMFGCILGNVTLAVSAERLRFAWGRGFLLSGFLCLGISSAPLILSAATGGRSITGRTAVAAEPNMLTVGTDVETVIMIVFGIVGVSLGAVFWLEHSSLSGGKEPAGQCRAVVVFVNAHVAALQTLDNFKQKWARAQADWAIADDIVAAARRAKELIGNGAIMLPVCTENSIRRRLREDTR